MKALSTRIFLGCVAGALSVLVFHQTTLQLFFWLGWAPMAAFRTGQVAPFHAPLVASITFWRSESSISPGFSCSAAVKN